METAQHRIIRLLRLYGVRVSTAEVIDAMHAVAQPGVLEQRHLLHAALTASLVKDRRDLDTFDLVFDRPHTDPGFPLYAFVFLVALGIDYNIFLMARVREETLHHGTRTGMIRGLAVTGGVITSAGIVLAGTFSVLGVLPLVFLTQIGFVVAFGVLLDTFLVRSVLVPALVLDIGQRVWWPSQLARTDGAHEPERERAAV